MKTRILLATIATTTMLSLPVFAQTAPVTTPVAPVVNPGGPNQPVVNPGGPMQHGVPNPTPNLDPGHPRVSQVQGWVNQQENNTVKAEEAGKITGAQEQKDLAHDQHIQNRLDKDMSKDGGHITKANQRHLDKSLGKNYHRRVHQKQRDAGKK